MADQELNEDHLTKGSSSPFYLIHLYNMHGTRPALDL